MNILGWILAVFGLAGLIFGLRMMWKSKKMSNVPFRQPSEISGQGTAAADAKGMVSTEGAAQLPQPLTAPMSGEQCIAYELSIERKWEKHVKTEKGMQKRTGSTSVHREYRGSIFMIGDGQGSVVVDATREPESEYERSHSSTVTIGMMIPGALTFGNLQMNTPTILDTESRTTAFVGTEKVLRPSPTMYALGQLDQGPQGLALTTPKGLTTGKLVIHHKGRAHLTGKTKRNMIVGYAVGGALFVAGVPLGLFGTKAQAQAATDQCASSINLASTIMSCSDRMYAASGKDYTWTVTDAATYSIELKQPAVANPIDGVIEVFDASGKQVVYDDGGSASQNAHVTQVFQPGTYRINVRDFDKSTVSGGYGYQLVFTKQASAPAPQASVASADKPAATAHGGPAPTHSGAAPAHSATPGKPSHK